MSKVTQVETKQLEEEKAARELRLSFPTPVENNSGGLLALMFRKLMYKLGYNNSIDRLCKLAMKRDQINRSRLNSPVLDDKVAYRLNTAARAPKMTFDMFVKLMTNLANIDTLEISVKVKRRGSDVYEEVTNTLFVESGTLTDMEELSDDDIELLKESLEEENEQSGTKCNNTNNNRDVKESK